MSGDAKLRVLIADKLSDSVTRALEGLGAVVTTLPEVSSEQLAAEMKDTEVLIVRSTRVTQDAIAAANALSLIIRAGAGVNNIDLGAANRSGIHVSNCPGKNTDAVAELALGMMIACDRRIVDATIDLRSGKWRKKEYSNAVGLRGRMLGIVGYGAIGQALAERAKALHMHVAAWSRSLSPERAEEDGVLHCSSPLVLAGRSDIVSVHLASTPETERLLGAAFFAAMKRGAIFINTARGEVVDSAALVAAIREKKLRVGVDVFADEPAGGEAEFAVKEFASLLTATPHIGASTDQASEAIASEVVRIVRVYTETGKPPNCVNTREKSIAPNNLVVRHFNRVGVLASVLDELKQIGVNIEEMENTIFADGTAASCTLKLDDRPDAATIEKIRRLENVIQVSLK